MRIKFLAVASMFFFGVLSASAQLTITPTATSPTPTCLSRLETTLIYPGHYPDDNTFIQSPEGTMGVTMFFEIGPYGEPGTEPYTGTEAMIGVGETSINRYRNNDHVENVNDHGEVSKGGIIAVIKESDAWHHATYHGEGTLLKKQSNRFYSVLNGDPYTFDCGGLIWSLIVGENVIAQFYGTNYPPVQQINLGAPPTHLALYYGSSSFGNVTLPGVSTVNQQYVQSAGSWFVPKSPSGGYLENFFLLTNAIPAFSSFI